MATKGQMGFDLREPPQDPFSEDYITKGPDGRYYTKWGLGQSLVEVPFIWLHRLTTGVHLPTTSTGHYFLMRCTIRNGCFLSSALP